MPKTRSSDPKIISFYSHKGGVGKTTAIHNIAYILAEKLNYRVLLIDADPQCSLTGLMMHDLLEETDKETDVYEYLDQHRDQCANIYDAFAFLKQEGTASNSIDQIVETTAKEIRKKLVTPKYIPRNNLEAELVDSKNLAFLPGHRDFYKLNKEATFAYNSNLIAYSYVKTVFRKLFIEITRKGKKNSDYDFILIDLNPGATRLNQILLMGSDYFIIPVMPDHFSKLSLTTLTKIFENWIKGQEQEQLLPKFLGIITQRVFIRNNIPVYADQNWLDIIHKAEGEFITKLRDHNMVPDNFVQYKVFVKSFSTLGLEAQNKFVPIVAIKSSSISDIIKQFDDAVYNMLSNMTKEDQRNLQFYIEGDEIADDSSLRSRKKFVSKCRERLQNKKIDFDWDFGHYKFPYIVDDTKVLKIYFLSKENNNNKFKFSAAKQAIYMIENGTRIKSTRKFYREYKNYINKVWEILKTYASEISDERDNFRNQSRITLDTILESEDISPFELYQFINLLNNEERYLEHYEVIKHVIHYFRHFEEKDIQLLKKEMMQYENSKNDMIKQFEVSKSEFYQKFIKEVFSESTQQIDIIFRMDDTEDSLLYLLLDDLDVKLTIEEEEGSEVIELNCKGQKQLRIQKHGNSFGFGDNKSSGSSVDLSDLDQLTTSRHCAALLKSKFTDGMNDQLDEQTGQKDYVEKRWIKNIDTVSDQPNKPVRIIANFNHKGGVGKTTTTYHLAVKYSMKGKRVLIIDADPQCNLSSMAMQRDFELFSGATSPTDDHFNFYSLLYFFYIHEYSSDIIVQGTELYKSERYDTLFLLPAKFDEISTIVENNIALLLSRRDSSIGLRRTHQLNKIFKDIAKKFAIDMVFIDLSPSISYVNQLVLMNSDYFLVPYFPDYQSQQAIISLSTLLPFWYSEMKEICNEINRNDSKLPMLAGMSNTNGQDNRLQILQPKLLHIIPQRYSLRNKVGEFRIVKIAQAKIEMIYQIANGQLKTELEKCGMWDPAKESLEYLRGIPNFHSCGIVAQMTGHTVMDVPLKNLKSKKSEKDFYIELYEELVTAIDEMIDFYENGNRNKPQPIPNPGVVSGVFSQSANSVKRKEEELTNNAKKQKITHNEESESDDFCNEEEFQENFKNYRSLSKN